MEGNAHCKFKSIKLDFSSISINSFGFGWKNISLQYTENIPYGQSSVKLSVIMSFGSFRSGFWSFGSFGSFGS